MPVVMLVAYAGLAPTRAAAAAPYVVNTNTDGAAVPSDCSGSNTCTLRDAISLANTAGGTNSITFAAAVTSPIVLNTGTLTVAGENLAIHGLASSTTIIDGNDASTVFTVSSGATLTLSDATVQHGAATTADGGGFSNAGTLNLLDDVVTANAASTSSGGGPLCPPFCTGSNGGGIASSGTLTLTGTTVSGNTAISDGGGINVTAGTATLVQSTFVGNTADFGAGVLTRSGTLTASQDLFDNNDATSWSGALWTQGSSVVVNSTFFNNHSGSTGVYGWGAGVLVIGGTLSLVNDTIVDNTATDTGGGLAVWAGSVASVSNTLVAGSSPTNCYSNGAGTFTSSGGGNDDSDNSCLLSAAGDRHDADPMVDTTVRSNGGPTQTLAVMPGSPLIAAGSDAVCVAGAQSVDQRGVTRPQGAHCDIGAFEVSSSATNVTATQPVAGGPVTITATVLGPNDLSGVPQGSVAFTKNGAPIGSQVLPATGPATASITLTETDAADPAFAATYTPTNGFAASTGSVDFTPNNGSSTPPPPPPPPPTSPTTPETGAAGHDLVGVVLIAIGGIVVLIGSTGRPCRSSCVRAAPASAASAHRRPRTRCRRCAGTGARCTRFL